MYRGCIWSLRVNQEPCNHPPTQEVIPHKSKCFKATGSVSTSGAVHLKGGTVDDRNPAWPYIDLTYQKYRSTGRKAHIHIHVYIRYIHIYICTTLPEFVYFWYTRSVQGHAGFLSATVPLGSSLLGKSRSCRRELQNIVHGKDLQNFAAPYLEAHGT